MYILKKFNRSCWRYIWTRRVIMSMNLYMVCVAAVAEEKRKKKKKLEIFFQHKSKPTEKGRLNCHSDSNRLNVYTILFAVDERWFLFCHKVRAYRHNQRNKLLRKSRRKVKYVLYETILFYVRTTDFSLCSKSQPECRLFSVRIFILYLWCREQWRVNTERTWINRSDLNRNGSFNLYEHLYS